MVVAPYMDYPVLLAVLLRMLGEGGDASVKRDLLRLLGTLGALDPHRHKVGNVHGPCTSRVDSSIPNLDVLFGKRCHRLIGC